MCLLQGCLRRGSWAMRSQALLHSPPAPGLFLSTLASIKETLATGSSVSHMHLWPSYPSSILCLINHLPGDRRRLQQLLAAASSLRGPGAALRSTGMLLPQAPSSTYVLGTTPFLFLNSLAFSFPNPLFPYTASSYTECERHCSLHK